MHYVYYMPSTIDPISYLCGLFGPCCVQDEKEAKEPELKTVEQKKVD